MVAGRVKAAMGFQRSPKEPKSPARGPATAAPPQTPGRMSAPASPATAAPASSGSKAAAFARSFGMYFPRSSAQVQPARTPAEVGELLRIVEELQERESRLRVELLEQKILRETVAIVPLLETELAMKGSELEKCRDAVTRLESENAMLRAELDDVVAEVGSKEQRILEMEKEMAELRKQQQEGEVDAEDCLSSASALSEQSESSTAISANVAKLGGGSSIPPPPPMPEPFKTRSYTTAFSRASPECSSSSSPSTSSTSYCSSSETAAVPKRRMPELSKLPPIPPPPPPRPPPMPMRSRSTTSSPWTPLGGSGDSRAPPPPPPPPPLARRESRASSPAALGQCVRRVPEVVEFYHSLMRRDAKRDGGGAGANAAAAARDMIGEIENRSAHLLAIKSDVERQGGFIRFLIKEVEGAAFVNIEDVVTFVKWLDDELSCLVDERAVLKHFDWPEKKADALREAAFGYCDLKKVAGDASLFCDDARQPCSSALKKMQTLFERLEHGLNNLARVREGAMVRYSGYQIPCAWMEDTGIVSQIKLQSVKLAMKYLKRVSSELEAIKGSPDEEELMLQGVRFAFRVHQFAGGFDVDTMRAFQELKEKASLFRIQRVKQNWHLQQQRLVART